MYLLKDISVCLGETYDDGHVCANFGYDLQYVSTTMHILKISVNIKPGSFSVDICR